MIDKLPVWLEIHLRSVNRQNMHHALLITGRKGVGKKELTKYLSTLFLCHENKQRPCGECYSCKISELSNHPDFHELVVLEDKKLIGISQIHELRNKLYESSFLGKNKVAVIPNLEKISIDGLNAILKILEEPPANTFFFLTTDFLNQIPLTIRSRSFGMKVSTPSIDDTVNWLSDYPRDDSLRAIQLTNNLPFAAKEFLDNDLLKTRKEFVKDISGIIKEGKDITIISEKWIEETTSLNLKIEWMSQILSDSVKFNADQSIENLNEDTDKISKYLSSNANIHKIHKLISKTNSLWNLFSRETNLRKDYQLNALFIDWEKYLGISKKFQ